MIRFYKKLIILFSLSLLVPLIANAQGTLTLSPSSGSYKVGESFSVLVNLNSGGESVNASTGQISFDNTRLQVVSLGYSQSIFNLWAENPSFSNSAGTINFSGGLPSPGFTGASGGVLRITFKAKAIGQAPANFLSGSILANDGQGTNIADTLRGALYNINPADTGAKDIIKTEELPVSVAQSNPVEVPIITNWPKELKAGQSLTIEGLGMPLTKISIILEKGTENSVNEYTFSGSDGKFKFTYDKQVETGYYRLWARNVLDNGSTSGLSDPITVEITAPTFIKIGSLVLDYFTIMVTLLFIIILLIIVFIIHWLYSRRSKNKRNVEADEAQEVLHQSFETLKKGLSDYITYLLHEKTPSGIKKRELETRSELKIELDRIEAQIKREIKDINLPPSKK